MWPWTKTTKPVFEGLRACYTGREIASLYRARINRLKESLMKLSALKRRHETSCKNAPAPCELDNTISMIQSNMTRLLDVTEESLHRLVIDADYMLTAEEHGSLMFSPMESVVIPEGEDEPPARSMAN